MSTTKTSGTSSQTLRISVIDGNQIAQISGWNSPNSSIERIEAPAGAAAWLGWTHPPAGADERDGRVRAAEQHGRRAHVGGSCRASELGTRGDGRPGVIAAA